MALIHKGKIESKPKEVKDRPKPLSFEELKARSKPVEVPVAQKVVTKPQPVKQQVAKDTNGNLIKPKYMEDKSVYYKSSGYLKDLLGEGN